MAARTRRLNSKPPVLGRVKPAFRRYDIAAGERADAVAVVWKFEGQADRVLRQRRAFRDCLASFASRASDVDAAELIFGELVANTVRYAKGAVEARLELHNGCSPVLVVSDHGPGMRVHPWAPHRDPLAESGRGLGIVELLAREVAVGDAVGGGTVVRATLPVTPRKPAA
jgi:anti-sigma regulatory factor (Ser/Thr protein kinase)